ncbi:MAG: sigma-70 family RNA polymerase sigma factor [Bacteroidia bacterium]|nr:sigma-70 family RNA polymerase sigma factor [Bacteroidia bacterium]
MLKVLTGNHHEVHHALVEACKRGDRKAQHKIYKLYARAMFNVCMRITNHGAEAEDILQDAFLDAFRKINTFKGESTFGAWLKRIVINRSINHLRKRKWELISVDTLDFEDDKPDRDEEDLHLQLDKVHQAIQLLPDGFRMVLSLYLLEGYDHKEIAEILGITESTSKSQYNRAKKKLVKMLKTT